MAQRSAVHAQGVQKWRCQSMVEPVAPNLTTEEITTKHINKVATWNPKIGGLEDDYPFQWAPSHASMLVFLGFGEYKEKC